MLRAPLWYLPAAGKKYITHTQSQLAGQRIMRHSHATHVLVPSCCKGKVHDNTQSHLADMRRSHATYNRYHFVAGEKYMTNTQSQLAGQLNMRHSHATYDLVNAITEGDYPKWDMYVQEMEPAKQKDYWFDPLDCTKVCLALGLDLCGEH